MTEYLLQILIIILFFLLYLIWTYSQERISLEVEEKCHHEPIISDELRKETSEQEVLIVKPQKISSRFDNCSKIPSIKYKCLTCNQPCHLSDIKRPLKK